MISQFELRLNTFSSHMNKSERNFCCLILCNALDGKVVCSACFGKEDQIKNDAAE
jgi:hypothetical protein